MRCQSNEALHAKIFIEFVALIIRNRIHFLLKEQMLKVHQKENYMTVPAAVRELEKIEIVRQTDGEYYRDYAVTRNAEVDSESIRLIRDKRREAGC